MIPRYKSRLANLHFGKLDQEKAAIEMKKVLDTHLNLKLTSKNVYSVDFLGRKFIFVLVEKYASGSLVKNIISLKGIFGIILSYDSASGGYFSDKILVSDPLSSKKISLMMLNLRGKILYSGTGNVKKSGIDFTIKGEPSEGPVRTTISGTIGSSTIDFKESTMPNKIYKKRRHPSSELQENDWKQA
jgi:hypothetical protein